MTDPAEPPAPSPAPKPPSPWWGRFRLGCLALAVTAVAVPVGIWQWSARRAAIRTQQVEEAHAQEANDAFEPAIEALSEAAAVPETQYDIDETIRVIHQIDLALKEEDDLEGYLRTVAVQDYSDVAPEVLEARKDLMDVLLRLYAKQTEAEEQEAMWDITSELILSTLSVVEVSGDASLGAPEAAFSVDRAQAQELLTELKAEQRDKKQLTRDISALQKDLIESLFTYGDTYFKYVKEWDALSVLRDRAYLAAHDGNWEEVIASSDLAIAKAPKEREAHLLKAMAMIELDDPETGGELSELLTTYIEEHPDASAPAFLLLGVHLDRRGDKEGAKLAFQQAAAYYPKQSEALTDLLDPYRMRAFLRKSREGSFIVELYKSTMLGSGYFSPDLQMAKMLFEEGEDVEAQKKVLDHFARRRAQEQWDFVLSDLQFCHDLLGPDFWEIFPEDTYLDLVVSPTMMGSSLNLAVNNRSPRTLHNATLVLVLHFTDTYPDDYEAIPAGTQPAVLAHDSTSYGAVPIEVDVAGKKKGVTDIVTHRAILVTNEAVMWVDTDEYKIAESEEFREKRRAAELMEKELPSPESAAHPGFKGTVEKIVEEAHDEAALSVESGYGDDDVLVKLPRELAILRPIFRLRKGDEVFSASDNVIEGDQIVLRFSDVDNWDDTESPPTDNLELSMASPFGDLVLSWTPGGDLTWRFEEL